MAIPCFMTSVPVRTSLTSKSRSITTRHAPFAPVRSLKCPKSLPPSLSSIRAELDQPVQEKIAWADALEISQVKVGTTQRVVLAGLDICIACDYDGQVYALGNKGPPLGVPLSDGSIVEADGIAYLQCPQYSTFELSTGKVKDMSSWIRSPPLVSNVLRLIFPEPTDVPVYAVRESGGMLQV